jgi:hypothetical protein
MTAGSDSVRASYVFISYAREDGSEYAKRLAGALAQHGYRAWWDQQNLNPSLDFSGEIETAIEQAKHVLVCITPSLLTRKDGFVRKEILYAQTCGKPIVPLRFPGGDLARLPLPLADLTWIPFFDSQQLTSLNFSTGLERLLSCLSQDVPAVERVMSGDPFQDYLKRLHI